MKNIQLITLTVPELSGDLLQSQQAAEVFQIGF